MQAPAHVQAAIELLAESTDTGYPADRLMANYFRARRYIGSKDKAAISSYFYDVLRRRLGLEYLLHSHNIESTAEHTLAVHLKSQGVGLHEVYTGQLYQPAKLKQRKAIEEIDLAQIEQAPLSVRLNVPSWLAPELQASLGEAYEAEMQAAAQRASTDVRVNTLNTKIEHLAKAFSKYGYATKLGKLTPWAIRFEHRVALFNLSEFKQGHFEIQDQGSQLLALMSAAAPGQRVVDFCAGAGGKSLALAAMMENKGVLYACDVHSKRLSELEKRARRAGVHNVRTHLLSSERDKWVKKHQGSADVVLIDAPCSGTGTWRRSPDSRFNLSAENLAKLKELQASILASASRLVKPGGRLLYATCSLLEGENEQQITQFLQQNTDYLRLAMQPPAGVLAAEGGSEIRLLSSRHETDGFFVAQLQRANK